MPLPQNVNVLLGAGVFGIVCAATLYVVEHYRQDRRRHAMAKDLARLNTELAVLREELNSLLALQKQKATKRREKRVKKTKSILSSTSATTEDYASAFDGADSSDLEFFDVSDDDDDDIDANTLKSIDLVEIDLKLEDGTVEVLEACLRRLQDLCLEHPGNPELLWRVGKAHYRLFEKTDLKEHIAKGVEACTRALDYPPESADVHKWLAVLIGTRSKFQPMKERILDGHLFEKHVTEGLKLNPLDPTLHYMMGRFAYDVADLKWYEKKVAAALFAEPPSATFEEALEHFLEADKLSTHCWKENKLGIAKCHIKLGQIEAAVKVLEEADRCDVDNGVDDVVDAEIKELLNKYRN